MSLTWLLYGVQPTHGICFRQAKVWLLHGTLIFPFVSSYIVKHTHLCKVFLSVFLRIDLSPAICAEGGKQQGNSLGKGGVGGLGGGGIGNEGAAGNVSASAYWTY